MFIFRDKKVVFHDEDDSEANSDDRRTDVDEKYLDLMYFTLRIILI